MKSVQLVRYGGSDALELKDDSSNPTLQSGQVLVQVHAATINPFDITIATGVYKDTIPLTFPLTPGGDFSGEIIEVNDVSDYKKGDRIFGTALTLNGGSGAFAQIAAANVNTIARSPQKNSIEEAAALPLIGSSAVQALEEHIALTPGQKILIHGGAGGIGHIAIQLAKSIGAFVATTVSTADMDFAKQLGADEVIDYKTQKFETMLTGMDAVFDTVGGDVTTKSFIVLKKDGVLVSMKGPPDEKLGKKYSVKTIGQNTKNNHVHLARVAELVDSGKIRVHIDKTFQLRNIHDMWDYAQSGKQKGKIVLMIHSS